MSTTFENRNVVPYDSPEVREAIVLMLELDQQGKGDPHAEPPEDLADRIERNWSKLSALQRQAVWAISADIQMLEGKEVFREGAPIPLDALTEAYVRNDWPRLLQFLRNGYAPDFAPEVAFRRYRAYLGLGYRELALGFL